MTMTNPTILLLSCYELGHQPLSLAWPLAALEAAGLAAGREVAAVDLAIDPFPAEPARTARLVAIAAPMHTALRIGVDAAQRVRQINPGAHICFYGLYAWLNRDYLLRAGLADSLLAGEYEDALVQLALDPHAACGLRGDEILAVEDEPYAANQVRNGATPPILRRLALPLPQRDELGGLNRYARYIDACGPKLAGYVEATRGCLHTCRHCPLTPVYGGRLFAVPQELVLEDIRRQVAAGAQHITFGDPDFLNGPKHSLRIARRLHAEWPALTFDFTAKVEHLLEQAALLPELVDCGATFVVSAFESTSDRVLTKLDKGHTLRDMEAALAVLRSAGLQPQPTWLPFTPWTTLDDYLHLLGWIRAQGLVANTPAVQLSIRLLIPPDSALLPQEDGLSSFQGRSSSSPERSPDWLRELDAPNFGWRWEHPDPRMDQLQAQVAALAEAASDDDPYPAFAQIEAAAYAGAGRTPPPPLHAPAGAVAPPRLSEHWFC